MILQGSKILKLNINDYKLMAKNVEEKLSSIGQVNCS